MNAEINAIPARVRELREILEIPQDKMAGRLGVSAEEYLRLESGERDMPISTLYEIAAVLNVDFSTLLTGKTPKMATYTVTRGGKGAKIERYPGYDYTSLSYNFKGREMEPILVNLTREDGRPALVSHSGQEFNYVIHGTVRVTIARKDIILEAGDCIYFDPVQPHGQSAVTETASFLTVIKE